MKRNQIFLHKVISVFLYINVIQVFTILLLGIYSDSIFVDNIDKIFTFKFRFILILLGILALTNVFSSYKSLNFLKKSDIRICAQEQSLNQISELNNTLRAQRHDFLNNLQVVYSLIQLDEYDDAKEYIEEVYKDIKKVSRVMKTKDTAVNALLQAKILDSESKKIKTKLDITSTLEQLSIPSWEVCRVLGNLIDNAIFELCKIKKDRQLTISINEELNHYIFIVKNNGRPINEGIIDRIFEPNFTTKGEKGQGMGLAITRKIVEQYNGEIKVESNIDFTMFTIKIPIDIKTS